LEPMKKELPVPVASGVITSITSSRVPAGTVAVKGTSKIVSAWSGMLSDPEVAIRFDCQSPPGNAEPWFAYKLTVSGWPVPLPD
jgi:hypothetical protein